MKRMRSMLIKVCFHRCKNDHLQRTFDFGCTFIKMIVYVDVMVTLIIGFQILRFFCVAYGICAGRNFILQIHLI